MAALLVTGADRPLGGAVLAAARRAGYEAVGCTAADVDHRSPAACERLVADIGAVAVLDCAARGRGDAAPAPEPADCAVLARAAARAGALSVLASSADVFDGARAAPWLESDPPCPATPAGAAWAEAEEAVTRANPRHAIVRAAWLAGGGAGDRVEDALLRCAAPGAVPFDGVAAGTLATADDAARALVELAGRRAYGVFHLAGDAVTALALARAVARALGLPGRPAPAAGDGRRHELATRRDELAPLPDWRLALAAYLDGGTAARSPEEAWTSLARTGRPSQRASRTLGSSASASAREKR